MTRVEGAAASSSGSAHKTLWNALKVGEVGIGCCPSGFVCADDLAVDCSWSATPGQVQSGKSFGDSCSLTRTAVTIGTDLSDVLGGALRVQLVTEGPKISHASRTSSPGHVASNKGSHPGGSGSGSSTKQSGKLSIGAKVGIGLCILLIFIAAVIALSLWRLRRSSKKAGPDQPSYMPSAGGDATGTPGLDVNHGVVLGAIRDGVTDKPELETNATSAGFRGAPPATAAITELPTRQLDESMREQAIGTLDPITTTLAGRQELEDTERKIPESDAALAANTAIVHELENTLPPSPPHRDAERGPAPTPSQPLSNEPWRQSEPLDESEPPHLRGASELPAGTLPEPNAAATTPSATRGGSAERLGDLRAEEAMLEAEIARFKELRRVKDEIRGAEEERREQ
ncbi:hypothetical protein FGG08_007303 [Glutinoglossum americanum]|uniref:Uncharacterized protein n=1 Tax=Glutinoglossum americanum TaxID=1670608 RepID=A0A9P8HU91_9PEZI|nr:hypothetical protein FGG08_007303 [Glutinoglossum americanum]